MTILSVALPVDEVIANDNNDKECAAMCSSELCGNDSWSSGLRPIGVCEIGFGKEWRTRLS